MAEAQHTRAAGGETLSGIHDAHDWRSDLAGHVKLIAKPAYSRLLKVEPYLRRSVPALIVAFLVVVAAARFMDLLEEHSQIEANAKQATALTALASAAAHEGKESLCSTATLGCRSAHRQCPPGDAGDRRTFRADFQS